MYRATRLTLGLLIALALLAGPTTTWAVDPQPAPMPPTPHLPSHRPSSDSDLTARAYRRERPHQYSPTTQSGSGGPDAFGYTWSDTEPYAWIDAMSGPDSGLATECEDAAIPIHFPFKFYENSYTTVYASLNGYLTFSAGSGCAIHGDTPNPSLPNNVIAPYWGHAESVSQRVHYLQGGAAPQRFLVIEWQQVPDSHDPNSHYTFEAILQENGDIVFQYQWMAYDPADAWSCAGTGIEDSRGLDGFDYQFCDQISDGSAIRYIRPAPAARVAITPLAQGAFFEDQLTVDFQVTVRNTGELGSDTYNLATSSNWPASLISLGGSSPLRDTNHDGLVDTGAIAQAGQSTFLVRISKPALVNMGDQGTVTLTATSTLNPARSQSTVLQAAVAAPFAQIYSDSIGDMWLLTYQPYQQTSLSVSIPYLYGYTPALAEASSFVSIWSQPGWSEDVSWDDLLFSLTTSTGYLYSPRYLTDNSGADLYTYDYNPTVAVAPNGNIGVAWTQELWNPASREYQFNIYFALLDAAGNLLKSPVKLAGGDWGRWGDYGWKGLYDAVITATSDNRFVVAWQQAYEVEPGGACPEYCWVDDVFFAVRDANGNQVLAATNLTLDTAGEDNGHWSPNLAAANSGQALLTWICMSDDANDVCYVALDSAGNILVGKTALTTSFYDSSPDAVQMAGGKFLVAWSAWTWLNGSGSNHYTAYQVLNADYTPTTDPVVLPNPAGALTGSFYVSVAADQFNQGILTWTDGDWDFRRNLYYALVDGDGGLRTQPMIFFAAEESDEGEIRLDTSNLGYSATSNTLALPYANTNTYLQAPALVGGAPGGLAAVPIRYGNLGGSQATGVQIQASLDPALTYLADTSGFPALVNGNLVTWSLPNLSYLGQGHFDLQLGLPAAPLGSRYPVAVEIVSGGVEDDPTDNTAALQALVSIQAFLPDIVR